jgi:succinyl-CoA synthetase beta subunit
MRAETATELRHGLGELLGKTIKNQTVRACRVEQCVDGMECYLSLSLDPSQGRLRVLLSSQGGVDIEAHAERGALRSADVAFKQHEAIAAASRLADTIASPARATIVRAAEHLIAAFFAFEATLLEVNPLFIRPDGSWTAADLKLAIDDNALVRQPRLCDLIRHRADDYPEMALKLDHGFDLWCGRS